MESEAGMIGDPYFGQVTIGVCYGCGASLAVCRCATTTTALPLSPSTYEEIGASIGRLVTEKQACYGDSHGKSGAVMRILYPDGIPPEKLDDALTVVRVLDKLFRVASAPPGGDPMGESPWRDVAGYALLSVKRSEASRAA